MATMTAGELVILRNWAERKFGPVTWAKPSANAAFQAIEDAVQSSSNVGARSLKTYVGAAIETASPGSFTAGQKDNLFILWTLYNAQRGGLF